MKSSLTLGPVMPGPPMLPSGPLMPCETHCREMRTDKEGETERVTASAQLYVELLIFTDQAAHLGAWNPLFTFWTWRSW